MGYRKAVQLFLTFTCFSVITLNAELKKVAKIYKPNLTHMVGDGFRVHNYFPDDAIPLEALSPFVLLDYNAPKYFPPLAEGKRGVGAHPHRGFETVTFVYDGKVAHRDSQGGSGVIGAGDVQWMTAGSGVLHEEFHEEQFTRQGGNLHAVQLWVNLPKKDKMSSPKYQTLLSSEIRQFKLDDQGSLLRVIAGKYRKILGPASTFTPINAYDVHLKQGAAFKFDLPADHHSMILVMKGAIYVNKRNAKVKELVILTPGAETVDIQAYQESFFLVLSGEPIDEPVIQSGPFVMNTQEEIDQAHSDFNSGKFGQLTADASE